MNAVPSALTQLPGRCQGPPSTCATPSQPVSGFPDPTMELSSDEIHEAKICKDSQAGNTRRRETDVRDYLRTQS